MPASKSNNDFSGMSSPKSFGPNGMGFGSADGVKDPNFMPVDGGKGFGLAENNKGSFKGGDMHSSGHGTPVDMLDENTKIALPNIAEVEKSYLADNKAIEQCEDEALEALFGQQITGRLQDPQNAQILDKLNELVDRFNTTSARLEKIERGCQLLSEGLLPR